MNLTDRTDITGLRDDGISCVPLNDLQQRERERYFQRIADGVYSLRHHASCPICNCGSGTIVARKDRYGISQTTVVCQDCGVIYAEDPLDGSSLAKFYREQYRRIYDGHEATSEHKERYHEQRFADRTPYADMFLNEVQKSIALPEKGTVVEIGSGGGWNLIGFPAKGWTAIGYDFDVDEMEHGKRRGLDMRSGSVETAVSDGVKADLVLMIQFLEHAADPVKTLRDAAKLLNPDGVIFIGVPGLRYILLGGWGAHLADTLQNAHLFLFELKTLDLAAAKAGLKRIRGNENCTAIYGVDSHALTLNSISHDGRGDEVLRFISLLEYTSVFWRFVWKICGGNDSKATRFVNRAASAVCRRLGFNI